MRIFLITIYLLAFSSAILKAQKVSITGGLGYNYDNLYTNHAIDVHPNQEKSLMVWRTRKSVQGYNLMVQFDYNINKKYAIFLKAISGKSFESVDDSLSKYMFVVGGIIHGPIQRSFSIVTVGANYTFFISDNFQIQYQIGVGLLNRFDQEIYYNSYFFTHHNSVKYTDFRQNTQINNIIIAEDVLSFYYVHTKNISWGLRFSGIFSSHYFEKLVIAPMVKISI